MSTISNSLRAALLTSDPGAKIMATRKLVREWRKGKLSFSFETAMPHRPSWPEHPVLLPARDMPRRNAGGQLKGQVALWHSLAHIEFIAIDLALDICGRFGAEMGTEFVTDFLAVAADEAMHFALCARKLQTLGSFYGALPAHAGLWQAADDTRHDVAARLAIVPMVLEARGLDVTPGTIAKLKGVGDGNGVAILERILADEIHHVAYGVKHYNAWCANHQFEPAEHWKRLIKSYFRGSVKGPFNNSAREKAGLTRSFLSALD